MSDDKEDSVITRCTKCKTPMKNHRGPAGEHCQNIDEVSEDSNTVGVTGGESTRPISDLSVSLLREMIR